MRRSIASCTSCRLSVLEAFSSLAGLSLPARTTTPRLAKSQVNTVRAFSRISSLRQSLQTIEPSSEIPPPPSLSTPNASGEVPWYLQIEDPLPPNPISPLLALQEIPPLPLSPPAILSSVLNHLSTQIGLDNLVLLDLRGLDPPPALGSNLLMIIGTARSVKHLNVSADRFCRWARKDFKLRPYADGLLGRNELKLKLRRKARRMKLAHSVGNTVANGADDGITTGWICVNLGNVDQAVIPGEQGEQEEDAAEVSQRQQQFREMNEKLRLKAQETPEEDEDEYSNPSDEDYIGFGSRTNSPRIVVQMFVEEKRVEMDLEGLWDFRNTKRARRDEKAKTNAEAAVQMLAQEQDAAEKEEIRQEESVANEEDDSASRKEKGGETKIEEEIEDEEAREGLEEEKPLGGIGAS